VSERQVPVLMESIPHEELTVQRCLDTCQASNYTSVIPRFVSHDTYTSLNFCPQCRLGSVGPGMLYVQHRIMQRHCTNLLTVCGNVALPFVDSDIANCNSPCTDEANQVCTFPSFHRHSCLNSSCYHYSSAEDVATTRCTTSQVPRSRTARPPPRRSSLYRL